MEYDVHSSLMTEKVAKNFAKKLKKGDIITLDGDLGAGKTAFVKGLAEGMSVPGIVQSPTFTIVNEYHGGKMPLYHFDVYRIGSINELYDIGFDEYIYGEGVCAIEWAKNIPEIFNLPHYEITITKNLNISENYRLIKIIRRGE